MGLLLLLTAIAWLLFRIDAKLQAIGDMIHDASRPEEQRRLAAEKRESAPKALNSICARAYAPRGRRRSARW